MKQEVVVVIGAGGIGTAIARRQGFGKHILLADFNEDLLDSAAKELELASYKVAKLKVDVSSRASVRALSDAAAALGSVVNVVNTAGVSNSPIGHIYRAMIEASPSKRMASPDEVAVAASYLLGPDAGFVTGSDLLINGGVIAAMRAGLLPNPA